MFERLKLFLTDSVIDEAPAIKVWHLIILVAGAIALASVAARADDTLPTVPEVAPPGAVRITPVGPAETPDTPEGFQLVFFVPGEDVEPDTITCSNDWVRLVSNVPAGVGCMRRVAD